MRRKIVCATCIEDTNVLYNETHVRYFAIVKVLQCRLDLFVRSDNDKLCMSHMRHWILTNTMARQTCVKKNLATH